MADFGPLNDQNLNNMADVEEYLEAAGEVTGTYNWLNITHGDLTRIYTAGPLRDLPESKNILFSGSKAESIGIDLETAFFDEEQHVIENHKSGLSEMNSERSNEEYDAVRRTMQANIIGRHLLDYFDRITEVPLTDEKGEFNKQTVLRYNDPVNPKPENSKEYRVDLGKLQELEKEATGETNTTLAEHLRRMDRAYETGFDVLQDELEGRKGYSAGFLREADLYSTIPTEITEEQIEGNNTHEIAKMRWQEIYDELDDSLSGL